MTTATHPLFDPLRHEPVTQAGWDKAAALAAIHSIVMDASDAFSPQGLWPAHPLDEPDPPEARYSMLYMGAAGVIWSLKRLAHWGPGTKGLHAGFTDVVPTLIARNRDLGLMQQGGTASFLMGDSGLLLLEWSLKPSRDVADRLFDVVQGNLCHPAKEALWGSSGTLLAAIHMAEATGERRWADLCERGATQLLDATVADRTLATLQSLALRDENCMNWHPVHDPIGVIGRVPPVQDCHGAPGIVVRLATMPRSPAWDHLLLAAGELTWRAGPLRKGPGLCHGTSGNGYAFLKLWRRTGDAQWLTRARIFAMHSAEQVERERTARGHGRYSLWTGDLGVAHFLASCISADSAVPTLDEF
ncbi:MULTISPECIES: LanC-like protein [Ramlibacter]|uniref:LanC-like protein n=1 Tax=Ramlibacter aquaticus TaxID=2780094 RepID=A0ABR9SEB9_9BURK|nr:MULTISPECIES: LanC-like protein [Ramlibacter]MBE7940387.1 LanC-like protein [Ramlibacter aquaticus]